MGWEEIGAKRFQWSCETLPRVNLNTQYSLRSLLCSDVFYEILQKLFHYFNLLGSVNSLMWTDYRLGAKRSCIIFKMLYKYFHWVDLKVVNWNFLSVLPALCQWSDFVLIKILCSKSVSRRWSRCSLPMVERFGLPVEGPRYWYVLWRLGIQSAYICAKRHANYDDICTDEKISLAIWKYQRLHSYGDSCLHVD